MNTIKGRVCALCNVEATQKCSACKEVFYCSREHQKLHWKEHSKKCRSFKLAEDPDVGRYYVALRKIEAGEIVLMERKPLVAGPPQDTTAICLGCYVQLTAKTAVPCQNCGWPLCQKCKEHGAECEFTRKYRERVSITNYDYPHPTYRCVTVIRILSLRNSDPVSYEKLSRLEDHCEEAANQRIGFDESHDVARFVKRFFKLDDIEEDEIAKIIGVLQVNGHEVPTTEPAHVAIYDLASFFEHSCRANCTKSFTDEGGILVRAAIPIAKGEHITICYTDPLWGVTNRRHYLERTKFFECMCDRCKDPTEYGTMFNAVMCTKSDCSGYMLPPTFITSGKYMPDYVCNKCNYSISWETVEQTMEQIGMNLAEMKKDDVKACEMFIENHAKVIHENHYYNTDVKVALAQIIGQQDGGLPVISDELLSKKISLCKKLDALLRTLVPAESRVRGLILFEMHAAIAEFGRRQGPSELREMLVESKKALSEAYELLRYEPNILPEGKIAQHARKNLENMNVILEVMNRNMVGPT